MPKFSLEKLASTLLKPVDLALEAGETITLHGPSGSGKTLFLRAICDLDPNTGEAYLDDQARSNISPPDWRKKVAYLPAESHWWSENVADHSNHWDEQKLKQLGFSEEVLNWQTSRLSTGERQRLGLLRLLANQPEVLLLDEPTANLDQENTRHVEKLIREYQQTTGACVIWASHSLEQRQRIGGRTASMKAGQFQLEGQG